MIRRPCDACRLEPLRLHKLELAKIQYAEVIAVVDGATSYLCQAHADRLERAMKGKRLSEFRLERLSIGTR